mmetsp:Transcript_66596/g.183984  ORF Transcript_66596/g.183984 Transcript_66596/m.183984 type:complete len:102 (+) Transcript_66596:1-306(+)
MYGQMKYWTVPIHPSTVDIYCDRRQEECSHALQFSKHARILQWSWFGHRERAMITKEGMVIGATVLAILLGPFVFTLACAQRWLGMKTRQMRSLLALNRLL